MLLTKLKVVAALVLILCVLGTGASMLTRHTLAAGQQEAKKDLVSKPEIKVPDAPAAKPKEDAELLQGTWNVVEVEVGGKHGAKEMGKDQILVFTRDKLVIKYEDGSTQELMYQIDPKQKPRAIDLAPIAEREKGDTFKGIYEIDGDRLKLYYSRNVAPDAKRPAHFDPKYEDRGKRLFVLKRAPAAKADERQREEPWGLTTQGLQMSISATGKNTSGGPEFQVAIRNVGAQDVTLNLGMMLANGKPLNAGNSLFPTNIRLNLTDAKGKARELHFSEPRVAGRIDDYCVPLRVASVYTLKLPLSQFWSPSTKEFTLELNPGKYQVSAQIEAGGAKHDSGKFVMNFWEGKLQSNTLMLEQ